MPTVCSAYKCTHRRNKTTNISYFRFPLRDMQLTKKWVDATKRDNWIPSKYSCLCSSHFEARFMYRVNDKTRLVNLAVPSIFNFPDHIKKNSVKKRRRRERVPNDKCVKETRASAAETLSPTLSYNVQSSDHDHTYCLPSHLFHPARNSSERVSGWLCHLAESTGEEQAEAATCCDEIDIKDEPIFTDDDSHPLQEFEQIYIKEENFDLEYKSDLTISGSEQESSPVEGNHSTSHIGTLPIRDDPEVGTGGHSPISCSVCHKTFKWRYRLKQHLRLHTGERSYSCGVCSKTFKQSGSLNKHLLLHMGEHPYICCVCSCTFTQRNDLKKHSLQHTGERPYTCDVCSKTFTSRSNLKDHMQTHTGEKPYICDLCHKTFRTSSVLRRHSLLHTDSAV